MVFWLKFHNVKLLDPTKLHAQIVKVGQYLTDKNGRNNFNIKLGTEGVDFINNKHTLKITILEL